MDREYQLEIVPGVRGIPLHRDWREEDAFRQSWREEIQPGLMDLAEKRAGSEEDARKHFIY